MNNFAQSAIKDTILAQIENVLNVMLDATIVVTLTPA
jgi:hypothetical protein